MTLKSNQWPEKNDRSRDARKFTQSEVMDNEHLMMDVRLSLGLSDAYKIVHLNRWEARSEEHFRSPSTFPRSSSDAEFESPGPTRLAVLAVESHTP